MQKLLSPKIIMTTKWNGEMVAKIIAERERDKGKALNTINTRHRCISCILVCNKDIQKPWPQA